MAKYLLFDLDGTLLPVDNDTFIPNYVKSITHYFSDLIEPSFFARQLMDSTYTMITNLDPTLTNEQKFMADFFAKVNKDVDELLPLFEDYYQNHYHAVQQTTQPVALARQMVTSALERGSRIVLATNAVFPRDAVEQRMQWAGIADLPWELVTTYEDSHFCKPNTEYYAEIVERLGAQPEECLHIGNDMDEDLAAAEIGIPVVIVEDCLLNPQNKPLALSHFHGSLADVANWLAQRSPAD